MLWPPDQSSSNVYAFWKSKLVSRSTARVILGQADSIRHLWESNPHRADCLCLYKLFETVHLLKFIRINATTALNVIYKDLLCLIANRLTYTYQSLQWALPQLQPTAQSSNGWRALPDCPLVEGRLRFSLYREISPPTSTLPDCTRNWSSSDGPEKEGENTVHSESLYNQNIYFLNFSMREDRSIQC